MTADSALYIPPYKADDQDIVVELNSRFGAETFTVQPTRTGMPVLWVPRERLIEVLTFLRQVPKPYVMLYDLHGVDERLRTHRRGLPSADFSVFYHLMSLERNSDVMIKVALSERDLNLPTATRIWPNANWYEREVWDMFGIDFAGHPHLTRIMMPPTWEGHPLRKDFPMTGYVEVRYDEEQKRVVYEPVKLTQEFRNFDFLSPWEGTDYVLPGDEKAPATTGVTAEGKK